MATIHEVALKAGVSAGTVSRYLNGYTVKPANAAKIDSAVADLKYRENFLARSLRLNKTMSVGVLINNMKSNFATSIIAAIQNEIEKHDYAMVICGFRNDKATYIKQLNSLIDRQVDGLFIIEGRDSWTPQEFLDDIEIPVIAINTPIDSTNIDSYITDDTASAQSIVSNMIKKGHTDIAAIVGNQDDFTSIQRLNGFKRAIEDSSEKLGKVEVTFGDYTSTCGYMVTQGLIEKGYRCLFVPNYNMGNGALQAISEHGFEIGKDFSFASYNYFATTPAFHPAITSICPDLEAMGTQAAAQMMDFIANQRLCRGLRHVVPNSINWHDSVIELS